MKKIGVLVGVLLLALSSSVFAQALPVEQYGGEFSQGEYEYVAKVSTVLDVNEEQVFEFAVCSAADCTVFATMTCSAVEQGHSACAGDAGTGTAYAVSGGRVGYKLTAHYLERLPSGSEFRAWRVFK